MKQQTGNNISDFSVGEVVRWKWNGERGVVTKVSEVTSTIEVVFDSGADNLFWCDQIEKVGD